MTKVLKSFPAKAFRGFEDCHSPSSRLWRSRHQHGDLYTGRNEGLDFEIQTKMPPLSQKVVRAYEFKQIFTLHDNKCPTLEYGTGIPLNAPVMRHFHRLQVKSHRNNKIR